MNAHYSFSQNASGAPPAICPNYPQIWQLEEMWEEAAGRGGPFPPRTHHSELLEVFPELCLATVMRNPTNKNFIGFVVIAPGSFLLNQGGENSVRRTIRVAASIIHTEPWTMGSGRLRGELQPCSVPGMKGKLRVQCALLLRAPGTHWLISHKAGEAAGCGVGWNSSRALPATALNLKSCTKSITKLRKHHTQSDTAVVWKSELKTFYRDDIYTCTHRILPLKHG